jgi:Nucleotide modification associated domain 2
VKGNASAKRPMRLSSYIVKHDTGFAPNPFGRVCTLACCKPTIRRKAIPGDIVVGTGAASCGLSGRLVYAMRVEIVLPYHEYWRRYPSKRPSPGTRAKTLGDNIWHQDAYDDWVCTPGGLHDETDRKRDLGGRHVLISSDFYYFGRDAIKIPERFNGLIATTQGHKNNNDACLFDGFWKWLTNIASRRGRTGTPFHFGDPACECNRTAKLL